MVGQVRGVVLAMLLIAVVAAGCGSVDGDKGGSGTVASGGDSTSASGASGTTSDGETTAGSETTDGEASTESGSDDGDESTSEGSDESAEGDGGTAVTATSIPKKEYVKKGDAICENVPNEYNKLLGKLPKKQQENKQIAVPKAAIPPLRSASEEFAELGSPDGDQAKAEAIVAALEAAADGLEKEPNGELSGPKSSFAEFNKLTQELGFKTCSQL